MAALAASHVGISFDTEMAVKVLLGASCFEEAIHLSKKHNLFTTFLLIQIEYREDYEAALAYIQCCSPRCFTSRSLPRELAASALQLYGQVLLAHLRTDTIRLLIDLCVAHDAPFTPLAESPQADATPTEPLLDDDCLPDNFIQCFTSDPLALKTFLLAMRSLRKNNSEVIWNTLIELTLRRDLLAEQLQQEGCALDAAAFERRYVDENLALLADPAARYDADQALALVQMHEFREGMMFLYDRLSMYSMMLKQLVTHGDPAGLIRFCQEHAAQDPSLWIQLITFYAEAPAVDTQQITSLLEFVREHRTLSPLLVVQILAKSPQIQLGVVRRFVTAYLRAELEAAEADRAQVAEVKEKVKEMEAEIRSVKTYPEE